MTSGPAQSSWRNLPNALTALRILGSPVLIALALGGHGSWLGFATCLLVLTEWLDGFLARRLHVTSALGARLDTVADGIFYGSLLAALVVLRPTLVRHEWVWVACAVVSYGLSWIASWFKFRCLPSYHTWAAKGAWVVVGAGMVSLVTGWSAWPFRIAMTCVVLTNLEAIAITRQLRACQVDIPSWWHLRKREPDSRVGL
ncbi:MAG: CDP-alcohol phosphatidyltransferase family protein [Planctomycetes bacterium]|nr:CDP-alcohol phosphatidyltransferase family protein [Planctomycetota bacterium]MCB9910272.1 CDP-alcohol phosphatidyltransferase family protein [Planctomycetota bacterium]HPF13719.1 CDP-alcohol phosphatidyltransferase family protein [Planctomycetota bacterium]HRV79861.1 CDP-alcohol phosphatidyltransferase family protein [Planctomycetota bacterium]